MKKGKYTNEEILFLKEHYPQKGKMWCAEKMNRSEGSIRSAASKLGLSLDKNSDFFKEFQKRAAKSKVGKKRPEHGDLIRRYIKEGRIIGFKRNPTEQERKILSDRQKKRIKENGHPKGFLGHKRTEEEKMAISESFKKMWADQNHVVNSEKHRQKMSNNSSKNMAKRLKENPSNLYSRVKKGTVTIGDKTFFARSSWEANVASYFQFLKDSNEIKDWEHEPETFWFESIKRGVRSYMPDFKITNNDGSSYYVEVKGWMDAKSKTKIKRFAKYYPQHKLEVIDQKRYKEISKSKSLFKFWGLID